MNQSKILVDWISGFKEQKTLPNNPSFPNWYLNHVSILEKWMDGELSSLKYWKEVERIADEAGLTAQEYVHQVNQYDPIYFLNHDERKDN